MSGPRLHTFTVADEPEAWESAGFTLDGRRVVIGDIGIDLVGRQGRGGIIGWSFEFENVAGERDIDGIPVRFSPNPASPVSSHENGTVAVDHVVMFTPDLQRSMVALVAEGFEPRRIRDVPGSEPPRQQVFFWAGECIIELVGPVTPDGDRPASLWGLAFTVEDLDETAARLGERLGRPKPAVQEGRSIATVRTRDLDISVPLVLMSPHPGRL